MLACPVCYNESVRHVRRVTADEAAQHFVLRETDAERHDALRQKIAELWGKPHCDLLECNTCRFGFAWPYVAGDAEFYELAYGEPGYPAQRWEFDLTLAALRTLPTKNKRALEIGAGFGSFLDLTDFPRDNVLAVEYNGVSRSILYGKGYTATGEDIHSLQVREPFDFVFMFQVLEHMDRLDDVFARLRQITRLGASVFIAVPNPERIAFNECHDALLDMPPNHIGRWNKLALMTMTTSHGFVMTDYQRQRATASLAKEDAVSHYLRRAQQPGTLANLVRRQPRSLARRIAEIAVIAAYAPLRLPVWASARPRHGASLWAHFIRM